MRLVVADTGPLNCLLLIGESDILQTGADRLRLWCRNGR
jgi:hypothetical protein